MISKSHHFNSDASRFDEFLIFVLFMHGPRIIVHIHTHKKHDMLCGVFRTTISWLKRGFFSIFKQEFNFIERFEKKSWRNFETRPIMLKELPIVSRSLIHARIMAPLAWQRCGSECIGNYPTNYKKKTEKKEIEIWRAISKRKEGSRRRIRERERRKADDDKCWGMKGNDKLEAADWFPSDNFRFMNFFPKYKFFFFFFFIIICCSFSISTRMPLCRFFSPKSS